MTNHTTSQPQTEVSVVSWAPISFAPAYQISSEGVVISTRRNTPHILKPFPNNCGYLQVDIAGQAHLVHRLVALIHIGEPPNDGTDWVVDHDDFDVANNAATNLSWLPRSVNAARRRNCISFFQQ